LPAILLIIRSGLNQSQDALQEGISIGAKLSASIATEQYNITGDTLQLVTVLSQLPEVRRHESASTTAVLANILKLSPQYANILIADRSGEIWTSALPSTRKHFDTERNSFQNAIKLKQFSSGEYAVGLMSGKAIIGFGYPLLDSRGEVSDVILVSINFGYLNRAMNNLGLPAGGTFSIVDRNGIIIDRNLAADQLIGTAMPRDLSQRIARGPSNGDFIATAENGSDYIHCYRKLQLSGEATPYLTVLTSIPLQETQHKARQALIRDIAFLTPFLLSTVALVLWLGNLCFVDRIGRLREVSQRLADGRLDSRATDIVSGGELGELAMAFDDMANRLAARERQLVTSQMELDDLYNQAPCGYHSVDQDGTIVRINDTELGWLGYTREEVVGKLQFRDIITPEGCEVFARNFPRLKEQGMVRDLEYTLVRKDGSTFPVLLNASAILGEDGSFQASRTTTYDISERTVATQRLNELNQNLAKKIEEETGRRLQQERLLARHARLVALGEMIGAIAHQWRQPLTTLGATIQSIRMAWERQCLDQAFLTQAEVDAQKQLYYMSDTIEDFRNFFRPEKSIESFDIRDKIREAIILLDPQFANSGISLQIADVTPELPMTIRGYQNEFKQALLNLVSNSFDAIKEKNQQDMAAGGSAEAGLVTVTMAREEEMVVVTVRDNGCGIPPVVADKVFDPYFTSKSEGKGTGIGLYMSRLIIEESLAGHLSFTSGPNGTAFRIELTHDDSVREDCHG